MSTTITHPDRCSQQTQATGGNELGPDHPDRRQPWHLYQD